MNKIQTPRLLNNLYRDMRDRRMLVPAIVLVVALIAVPILLTKPSSGSPAAVEPAATGGSGESALEPAVLTKQQLGVRDYRKRLDELQAKDPFRRHFLSLPKSAKLTTTSSSSATSATTTSSTPTDAGTTGLSPATPGGSSSGGSTVTSSTSTPSSGMGGGNSNSSTQATPTLYSFRISVAVGPAGDLKDRDNVKRTAYLPGKNRPVVAFIGVSEDTKHAIFSVSTDVSAVRGDGRCVPRRGNCTYLELKPGDKASLDYAPEGDRTYNLKLRDITLVPVSKSHGNGSNKVGSSSLLGPDG
jgi:hypothetical protein